MNKWAAGLLLIVALGTAGCLATFIKDGVRGRSEATTEEREAVKKDVGDLVDNLRNIPVAGQYAGLLAPVLTFFGFAKIGRSKRTGIPASEKPFTGWLGTRKLFGVISFEDAFQVLADINTGLHEWGKDGSPTKRGIKTAISFAIATGASVLAMPSVRDFVFSNPTAVAGMGFMTALSAGLSKFLDQVKPVKANGA